MIARRRHNLFLIYTLSLCSLVAVVCVNGEVSHTIITNFRNFLLVSFGEFGSDWSVDNFAVLFQLLYITPIA